MGKKLYPGALYVADVAQVLWHILLRKCLNKNTMSVNVRLINVTCLKRAKQKHPLSCIKQNTD